jgi:hypothetical protein
MGLVVGRALALLLLHVHRVLPLLELELTLARLHQLVRQHVVLAAIRTVDVEQPHVLRKVETVAAANATKAVDSTWRRWLHRTGR